MKIPLALLLPPLLVSASLSMAESQMAEIDIYDAPHDYRNRELRDPFTRLKADFESGRLELDRGSEIAFLSSLLKALNIPASSQMLVFSTTSLQLSLITPSNPRALYFNEELYVGYIPGGRIEIISVDPALGAIFYIFDIPRTGDDISIERSGRCMNCHSRSETGYVPGLVIKSVVPGPNGGTLDAFRLNDTGHHIPMEQRFGGWYLTGGHGLRDHWANTIGRLSPEGMSKRPIDPASTFDAGKYISGESELLPQLLHEHQAGFVNRVVGATYRARAELHAAGGALRDGAREALAAEARHLVRYLLFTDEAPLPPNAVWSSAFQEDFRANARKASDGTSLKDFQLRERLFQYRCSYMIYSGLFLGMPEPLKNAVFRELGSGLSPASAAYPHLGAEEKAAIRRILRETLPAETAAWN